MGKDKKLRVSSDLFDISQEIQNIFLQAHAWILDQEDIDSIFLLETHKRVIFSNEATSWHLKIWAISLSQGD